MGGRFPRYGYEWPEALQQPQPIKPTMSLKLSIAALVGLAAELHAGGAVRPDHDTKFSMLRTGLDQVAEAADAAEKAAAQPAPPGVAEFAGLAAQVEQLRHSLEAVAVIVDHTGDQVEALTELANAPKAG